MHRKTSWFPLSARRRFALGCAVLVLVALSGLPFVLADRVVLPDATPVAISVRSSAFEFGRIDLPQTEFGRLEWRGGLTLASNHSAFGGFSGLSLSLDGTRLLAVSDRGAWLSGTLGHDGRELSGFSDGLIGALLDKAGEPISGTWENDAEALVALEPERAGQGDRLNGRYLIGYEGYGKRLEEVAYRDGALTAPLGLRDIPEQLRKLDDNKGIEGVAILRGGKYSGAKKNI
jgi:hypothetical protein